MEAKRDQPGVGLSSMPAEFLFAGAARAAWMHIESSAGHLALIRATPVSAIADAVAHRYPAGVAFILLGAGSTKHERRLLDEIPGRTTIHHLAVHEASPRDAAALCADLASKYGWPTSALSGAFCDFGFRNLPDGAPRVVTLFGGTLANVDTQRMLTWLADVLRPGDLLCFDCPLLAEADPRAAAPHFGPADFAWFRIAATSFALANGLDRDFVFCASRSEFPGARRYTMSVFFPREQRLVEVIRLVRYEPENLRQQLAAAGFEVVWRGNGAGGPLVLQSVLAERRA